MTDKWLNEQELEYLTGVNRAADQKRILIKNKIEFTERNDGKPVVCWYNVYHKSKAANNVDAASETDAQLGVDWGALDELAEPWDEAGISPITWLDKNSYQFVAHPNSWPEWTNASNENSGVYFLFQDVQLVYVGKSTEISKRLKAHYKEGKSWNKTRFIPNIPLFFLEHIEMLYIHEFDPPLNNKRLGVTECLKKYIGTIEQTRSL